MNDNCNDCPVLPRVEALEEANKQHSATHRRIFEKLEALKAQNDVQDERWSHVNGKLDSLTTMVRTLTEKINVLEHKPAKRWEGFSDKVIWFIAEAILIIAAVKVGLM